ncbi:MAG: undecaprenyldiphospho-muramoylpentapeptide beta-N-acetylglucosaminyltransferase [Tannerella sp.]|jgi:UDP-N-acetylglucosamine--N-acetylmuramyl-(pentapeptide) pyrophosphoryl-undecaprenol N-acetylglucosamine transferase|nr:undecaprenyldiphospho-muramoylpentapeptide beta-N-acetylglucosaminyltransferase [Tannerella sp.]
MSRYRIIISGGGTGGHIFPALSIAGEIRKRFPQEADILFVGANDRMEMTRVPEAGYRIVGLPVSGFVRSSILKNFGVAFRLLKSLIIARKHIRRFKPNIAVGVGGYASAPTLWMASLMKIPILIQEQNSYAGLTNKMLGRRAARICVAYRGMGRFFPQERIILTGNPVRKDLETLRTKDAEALAYFNLEADKPVLLVIGGSLGARTVNNGMRRGLKALIDAGVQVIWQTGRYYYEEIKKELENTDYKGLWFSDFITRMELAYAVADLVVSRAGAGSISELCLQRKPVILVPSPNVAEDHQTMNARALSDNAAAVLLPDNVAEERLAETAIDLIRDRQRLKSLGDNIFQFAQHNSAERIVDEIFKEIR